MKSHDLRPETGGRLAGRRADPTLSDFHHDMNKHAQADYRRLGDAYVLELDTVPGGGRRLLVWVAVDLGDCYADPESDNHYAWDAVGEAEFDDYVTGRDELNDLTAGDLPEWCQEHPYTGPRSPFLPQDEAGE